MSAEQHSPNTPTPDFFPSAPCLLREKLQRDGTEAFGWFSDEHANMVQLPNQGPYRSATTRELHPELNSKVIHCSGTLFLVIGGVAYGYITPEHYQRLHWVCRTRRVCSSPHLCWDVRECPRYYNFDSMDFIYVDLMDLQCQFRVSPDGGTVFLVRSGTKHGITSSRVFDNYQFDWPRIGSRLSQAEFDALATGAVLQEERGGWYPS